MRLSEFINSNREPILAEWEAFARTCAPASGVMDIAALRDHASEMLTVIAADLDTPQDSFEQAEKSKGNAPTEQEVTPAEEHGAGRAESGFTIEQMVSEYRALRASVVRLWTLSEGVLDADKLPDLMRFNEAIDQSLAESTARYTTDLDHSKEMFLAILGHDLRTPLSAVLTSAQFMLDTEELHEPHLTLTKRVASSSGRMVGMIGDLLDFTRSRLGNGIPIERTEMNMGKVIHDVVDEVLLAHPDARIELDTRAEEHRGEWDPERMSQVVSNLLTNALTYGNEGSLVTVRTGGDEAEITISVHNLGKPIPPERMNGIFNPMKSREGSAAGPAGPQGNLGLGLYIAERVVNAHQGSIEVESNADGTTFTVHLPRKPMIQAPVDLDSITASARAALANSPDRAAAGGED